MSCHSLREFEDVAFKLQAGTPDHAEPLDIGLEHQRVQCAVHRNTIGTTTEEHDRHFDRRQHKFAPSIQRQVYEQHGLATTWVGNLLVI